MILMVTSTLCPWAFGLSPEITYTQPKIFIPDRPQSKTVEKAIPRLIRWPWRRFLYSYVGRTYVPFILSHSGKYQVRRVVPWLAFVAPENLVRDQPSHPVAFEFCSFLVIESPWLPPDSGYKDLCCVFMFLSSLFPSHSYALFPSLSIPNLLPPPGCNQKCRTGIPKRPALLSSP